MGIYSYAGEKMSPLGMRVLPLVMRTQYCDYLVPLFSDYSRWSPCQTSFMMGILLTGVTESVITQIGKVIREEVQLIFVFIAKEIIRASGNPARYLQFLIDFSFHLPVPGMFKNFVGAPLRLA